MTRTATKPGRKKRALEATPWKDLSSSATHNTAEVHAGSKESGEQRAAVSCKSTGSSSTQKEYLVKNNPLKEIKKIRKSESRRMKRIDIRYSQKHCFNCRKSGHVLSQCPKTNKQTEGTGICFKCGSTKHMSRFCKVKTKASGEGAYPYATCFVCKKTGHISKDCPINDHGLYPNGGCCLECGSVRHFRKDCPEKQRKQGITNYTLSTLSNNQSADVELTEDDTRSAPRRKLNKRKTKLVTMI